MGSIADALVDIIETSGGEVILSSPVKSIGVEGGRVTGLTLARYNMKIFLHMLFMHFTLLHLPKMYTTTHNSLFVLRMHPYPLLTKW